MVHVLYSPYPPICVGRIRGKEGPLQGQHVIAETRRLYISAIERVLLSATACFVRDSHEKNGAVALPLLVGYMCTCHSQQGPL
jgi:hypothetical protein